MLQIPQVTEIADAVKRDSEWVALWRNQTDDWRGAVSDAVARLEKVFTATNGTVTELREDNKYFSMFL